MFQVARVNNNMIKAFVATNPAAGAFHAIRMPYPTGVERFTAGSRVDHTRRIDHRRDLLCCRESAGQRAVSATIGRSV